MIKVYEPRHFDPREFVPPEVWQVLTARGKPPLLVMDVRMLLTADAIREYFGRPVNINNWHVGGERVASGFRTSTCTVGELYSQHRFGRALDLFVKDMTAASVRAEILAERDAFPYVTAMEGEVAWVHVDCRAVVAPDNQIFVFKA